jgi:hypothetical protein
MEITAEQQSSIEGKCKGMINKQYKLIERKLQPLCCLTCSQMEGN